jgi:NADH:ubiquinone oxidoreductase subunit 6 (subunit J)
VHPAGGRRADIQRRHEQNYAEVPWEPVMPLKDLGELLFTSHAPAVLALAVLLTAVMIGAALFAREPSGNPRRSTRK